MPTTAAFHSYAYKKIMFLKINEKISSTNLGHLVRNILNRNWTLFCEVILKLITIPRAE